MQKVFAGLVMIKKEEEFFNTEAMQMRWYKPSYGDTKMRSWFAWLPVTVGNETRWLERVTVMYQYGTTAAKKWDSLYFVDD